ncbi:TRAP transporter small permease [Marispirochaeta sp.]|uniref:TRAP transporter small permease n=1 Tax=Marispirochaeta sp. TaxID=2038653 RepID=UPI0029C67E01|nr:TRAP transporter small permease [Marispirochaeta sp.]
MIKTLLTGLDRFSEIYQKILHPILVLLYSILTVVVLYAVFMRYVINKAPSWSEEFSRYMMVWSALLAMAVALRQGRHIGLSSLVERVWGKHTRVAFFLADVAMLIFFVAITYTGFTMAFFVANQRSPSMNWPMWIPYLSIPVGGFFLSIESFILMLRKLVRS